MPAEEIRQIPIVKICAAGELPDLPQFAQFQEIEAVVQVSVHLKWIIVVCDDMRSEHSDVRQPKTFFKFTKPDRYAPAVRLLDHSIDFDPLLHGVFPYGIFAGLIKVWPHFNGHLLKIQHEARMLVLVENIAWRLSDKQIPVIAQVIPAGAKDGKALLRQKMLDNRMQDYQVELFTFVS